MTSALPNVELPQGWTDDGLTMLMEKAYRNRLATFANKPEFHRLIAIHECFHRIATDWTNPQNEVSALLLIRSHAAFFSATEAAAATMMTETFVKNRACLENAAYGLHIAENPDLGEVWLCRHDGPEALALVKRQFTIANVKATLEKRDRHTAKVFQQLYDASIDFGAHPNERSVTGSLTIEQDDNGTKVQQSWFHGDGATLDWTLRSTAQTGVCALSVLQNAFPARFELLGVNDALLDIRAGL